MPLRHCGFLFNAYGHTAPQEQQGKSPRLLAPGYSPKLDEAVYKAHRANSCKPARLTPASRSSPGWSSRCGSTNGRWMPAAATPRDSVCVCSLKARWSAPTPSTTWYGMACFRSRQQSCRKPWSARAGDLGTGSTKSITSQAVQTARSPPPSVWKKAIGRAAPWWGRRPAMRLSSSSCWRKRRRTTLPSAIWARESEYFGYWYSF